MAKVSILGSVRGRRFIEIQVERRTVRMYPADFPLRSAEEPVSLEYKKGLWAFRDTVVLLENADHLSAEEQRLEIMHAVLRHEQRHKQRYERLRREISAFARFEKTEAARRERIPDEVKRFVFERDEGKCVKCGSPRKLEFDHIIPVSKGGSNTERNIQLLCERCNREKGDRI